MTVAEPVTTPRAPRAGGQILTLADGVELIGEYEGSGFKEPPLLARRADGQMIQLSRLLYLVAAECDGRRDANAVARAVTERYGRLVSVRNVGFVVEQKLRPLGVLALADGTTPKLPKREPVMALRHRKPLVPARYANRAAAAFTWLHRPPVQLLLLAALAVFDVWLFGVHGIAGGLRSVLYSPALLVALLASIVVATAFHELGHASACRYGGARPGPMGVGVYLVWPAFYCDVTEAYRLDRFGRLRTDLGGVYFNGLFALIAGLAYFPTGQEALLLAAFVQHTIVLQQLLPLLRFDGYYVVSDLTGVPDILSRIKPIFRSLLPGAGGGPRVDELKPWVRIVVTAYLLVLVPALAFMITSTVLAAPRMAATAYDSFGLQLDRLRAAQGFPELTLGAVQIGALVMPLAAIAVSLSRSGRMAVKGLLAWSHGSALRRAAVLAAVAAVAGGAGYTWWPNGDYQPLRPGERGTIGDALATIPDALGGRPSYTKGREARFGSVPTVRRQAGALGARARRDEPGSDSYHLQPGPARDRTDTHAQDDERAPTGADGGDDPRTTEPTPHTTSTPTPSATSAPTLTGADGPSATTTPTATSTPTQTATATATATSTPQVSESPTPTPTTPTQTGAAPAPADPSATPTTTPSLSQSDTPTVTPIP